MIVAGVHLAISSKVFCPAEMACLKTSQQKAMAPAPYVGHATQYHNHKGRQRGEGDHHEQSRLQRRAREKSWRWKFSCLPLHLSTLICKGLAV
jgi:hypothetical protein